MFSTSYSVPWGNPRSFIRAIGLACYIDLNALRKSMYVRYMTLL